MYRLKEVYGKKVREFSNIDDLLHSLKVKGFEQLTEYKLKEVQGILKKGTLYYTIDPYDAEINCNKSIIYGNDEDAVRTNSDLLSEEI